MIYRKEEFVEHDPDDAEFSIKLVDRLEATDGSHQRFIGRATLNMRTPAGVEQIQISFEIPSDSIEEAFREYPDCARPKIAEFKEHVQSRINQLRRAGGSSPDSAGGPPEGGRILRLDDYQGET